MTSGWIEYGMWGKEEAQGWLRSSDLSSWKNGVTINSDETCFLYIYVTTSVLGSEAVILYL